MEANTATDSSEASAANGIENGPAERAGERGGRADPESDGDERACIGIHINQWAASEGAMRRSDQQRRSAFIYFVWAAPRVPSPEDRWQRRRRMLTNLGTAARNGAAPVPTHPQIPNGDGPVPLTNP